MDKNTNDNQVSKLHFGNFFVSASFEIFIDNEEPLLSEINLKIFPFTFRSSFIGSNYILRLFIFSFYFGFTAGIEEKL